MEFKNLKTDDLALVADLLRREAGERDPNLAAALRRIVTSDQQLHGAAHREFRLAVALAPGLEACIYTGRFGGDASKSMIIDTVDLLVDAAERIFDDRYNSRDMLKCVRSQLTREVAKSRRRGLPCAVLGVSLAPCEAGTGDLPAVLVGLEVIGPMLTNERTEFTAESAEDVTYAFDRMRERQVTLLAKREYLAAVGGDVLMDAVTLAALEDAGIEAAQAIETLRNDDIQIIEVATKHGNLVLYTRDGVVTGNVPLGEGMRWREGRLVVPHVRGLTSKDVVGQLLSSVIDHDYFDENEVVGYISTLGNETSLRLQSRERLVGVALSPKKKAA